MRELTPVVVEAVSAVEVWTPDGLVLRLDRLELLLRVVLLHVPGWRRQHGLQIQQRLFETLGQTILTTNVGRQEGTRGWILVHAAPEERDQRTPGSLQSRGLLRWHGLRQFALAEHVLQARDQRRHTAQSQRVQQLLRRHPSPGIVVREQLDEREARGVDIGHGRDWVALEHLRAILVSPLLRRSICRRPAGGLLILSFAVDNVGRVIEVGQARDVPLVEEHVQRLHVEMPDGLFVDERDRTNDTEGDAHGQTQLRQVTIQEPIRRRIVCARDVLA